MRRALRLVLCLGISLWGQNLPVEPLHDSGQGVTAAFEGWFHNPDGSYSILLGYYNRNLKQELDIPVGPNNRIEPGGPDQGQPTHFLAGRQWGVFTVTAPKSFGNGRLTWTLIVNGQVTAVPANLNPLWEVEPLIDVNGNTPPVLRLAGGSAPGQGPRPLRAAITAVAGKPAQLTVSVADDAKLIPGMPKPATPPLTVSWSKFRGPGEVTFSDSHTTVEPAAPGGVSGKATTTATFSEPGEYILLVVANDWSGKGGRGFQCCWTNGQLNVSVKAP